MKEKEASPFIAPFLLNNLGMAHFYTFIEKSALLKDPTNNIDQVKVIGKLYLR
jgi:hypothetical protein